MSLTSEIIEEYHKTKDVKILLDELNRLTEQSKRHGREEYEMRDKLYTAKKLLFEMKELVDVSISWKKDEDEMSDRDKNRPRGAFGQYNNMALYYAVERYLGIFDLECEIKEKDYLTEEKIKEIEEKILKLKEGK